MLKKWIEEYYCDFDDEMKSTLDQWLKEKESVVESMPHVKSLYKSLRKVYLPPKPFPTWKITSFR